MPLLLRVKAFGVREYILIRVPNDWHSQPGMWWEPFNTVLKENKTKQKTVWKKNKSKPDNDTDSQLVWQQSFIRPCRWEIILSILPKIRSKIQWIHGFIRQIDRRKITVISTFPCFTHRSFIRNSCMKQERLPLYPSWLAELSPAEK